MLNSLTPVLAITITSYLYFIAILLTFFFLFDIYFQLDLWKKKVIETYHYYKSLSTSQDVSVIVKAPRPTYISYTIISNNIDAINLLVSIDYTAVSLIRIGYSLFCCTRVEWAICNLRTHFQGPLYAVTTETN